MERFYRYLCECIFIAIFAFVIFNNKSVSYGIDEVPLYNGEPYVVIDNNEPSFSELVKDSFELYSDLDSRGRCGVAFAKVGKETMPKGNEKRQSISNVEPSGWKSKQYSKDLVNGKYLYNRCHLIGYQLTGQNANPNNLITCTRETNSKTMLEFENKAASYIKETGNHVMYRVTPKFYGDNLVASGIEMEAKSVEDNGAGLKFHVYVYNVETGIDIDYKTGESSLSN